MVERLAIHRPGQRQRGRTGEKKKNKMGFRLMKLFCKILEVFFSGFLSSTYSDYTEMEPEPVLHTGILMWAKAAS